MIASGYFRKEMDFMSNQLTDSADVTGPLDGGLQVLPFYILCDESGSMAGASIDAVNDGIKQLFKALYADPVVDGKARVSIIAFSDTAQVVLPLSQLSNVPTVPGCTVRGSTSYSAAFKKLHEQIDIDVDGLKAQGYSVMRPVVFFISDGEPNPEPWEVEHRLLTDDAYKYRPHVLSFGVDGANPDIIKQVATYVGKAGGKPFAWMAESGTSAGPAITEIFKFITGSIIASGNAAKPVMTAAEIKGVKTVDEFILDSI